MGYNDKGRPTSSGASHAGGSELSRAVGPVITLTGEQAERACHTQDPAGHVPGHSDCTLAAELARTALCPLAGLHGVIYEASARTMFLHKCPRHRSPESLPGGVHVFILCWKATHLAPSVLMSTPGWPTPDAFPASGLAHGRPTGEVPTGRGPRPHPLTTVSYLSTPDQEI